MVRLNKDQFRLSPRQIRERREIAYEKRKILAMAGLTIDDLIDIIIREKYLKEEKFIDNIIQLIENKKKEVDKK